VSDLVPKGREARPSPTACTQVCETGPWRGVLRQVAVAGLCQPSRRLVTATYPAEVVQSPRCYWPLVTGGRRLASSSSVGFGWPNDRFWYLIPLPAVRLQRRRRCVARSGQLARLQSQSELTETSAALLGTAAWTPTPENSRFFNFTGRGMCTILRGTDKNFRQQGSTKNTEAKHIRAIFCTK